MFFPSFLRGGNPAHLLRFSWPALAAQPHVLTMTHAPRHRCTGGDALAESRHVAAAVLTSSLFFFHAPPPPALPAAPHPRSTCHALARVSALQSGGRWLVAVGEKAVSLGRVIKTHEGGFEAETSQHIEPTSPPSLTTQSKSLSRRPLKYLPGGSGARSSRRPARPALRGIALGPSAGRGLGF